MNVLLNTNVVLDYILKRDPFFEHAKTIFRWSYEQKIIAYVSASAVTDIYYLIQQAMDKATALNFIQELVQFIQIAGVDKTVVLLALQSGISDFEDAVQNAAAKNTGITHIITRNIKDYKKSDLMIVSPGSFIKSLQ